MNSETKQVVTDNLQKIYRMGNSPLAMVFTGAALLDNGEFNFIAELSRASQRISARRFHGLQEYASRIAGAVQDKLAAFLPQRTTPLPTVPSIDPRDYGQTILIVLIDGYHNNLPGRVRMRFCHEGENLLKPHIMTEDLVPGALRISGIPGIGSCIKDPSLRRYVREIKVERVYPAGLSYAISISCAAIEACGGPEAALIDPERAASIGGHTHIAVITPDRGFQWVIEPIT